MFRAFESQELSKEVSYFFSALSNLSHGIFKGI